MTDTPDDHAATRRRSGDGVTRRRRTPPGTASGASVLATALGIGQAACGGSSGSRSFPVSATGLGQTVTPTDPVRTCPA